MSLSYPEKCLRGLTTCQPYSQLASNTGEPHQQSFFCCGRNDGTMAPVPEDIYTLCFKGELRDDVSFNDKRDLVHHAHVIMGALAHIEEDAIK